MDRWYNKVLRIIGRIRNSNLFLYPVLIGSSKFESDQSLARDDYMDSSIHHLLSTLQTPTAITDLTTLLICLSAPLDALGLLPPRYRHLLSGNNTDLNINLRKYVPQIQHALLTNILPTWDTLLHEDQSSLLVEQYFCPDAVYNVRPVAGEIALCGYATLDQ